MGSTRSSRSANLEERMMFRDYKKDYGSMRKTECTSSSTIFSSIAQLYACFGKYVCMINVGIIGSFPVLALPFLTSSTFKIKMSENEMQWMVSIIYITMAIGSIISALPFETNRKIPMIIAQAVMTLTWITTYFAYESWQLIMARGLAGMSMTLSLPQVQAYIGEVSVPRLRGIFGNLTQTTTIMGQFVMSALTYLNDWDEAIFICGCFPVIAIIYLYFIPESPVILIKQKKFDKAWSALKQLRGWKWANEAEVLKEFRQLQRYCDMNVCSDSDNDSYCKNHCSILTSDSVTFKEEASTEIVSIEETYKKLQNDFSNGPEKNIFDSKLMLTSILKGIDNPTFEINENYRAIEVQGKMPLQVDEVNKSKDEKLKIDFEKTSQLSKNILTHWSIDSMDKQIENTETIIPKESMLQFLLKPEMRKPTLLMIVCSFFVVGPGADSILVYLQWYIKDFHSQVDYNTLVSLLTGATLSGNLFSVCCVSKVGKRSIILLSTTCVGLGYISLSLLYYLKQNEQPVNSWLFTIVLIWIFFMEEFGIRTIYHSLMSEVFPLRGKKVGPMIIVMMLSLNGFLVMHNMPSIISSYGTIYVILFDIALNLIGVIFFYKCLFETEGKTLREIEEKFKLKYSTISE